MTVKLKGAGVSSSPPASLLDVGLQHGKPPILRAEATGDAPGWAAEHRDALRAIVAEHGAVMVRGLGLRDAGTTAVFQRLSTTPMSPTSPQAVCLTVHMSSDLHGCFRETPSSDQRRVRGH
jgi:hypothetical protein